MYTKRLDYIDYDGEKREETFRFNFNEDELVEMEMTTEGGLQEMIQGIIDAKDRGELIKIFKKLILGSYGIKSADGKRFIKSEEISKEFSQTRAYTKMFMLLSSDDEEAAKFINGIMPEGMPKVEIDKETGEPKIIEDGKITQLPAGK